jgi:hypothetical protein
MTTAHETRVADMEQRFSSLESWKRGQKTVLSSLEGEAGKLVVTSAAQDNSVRSKGRELGQIKEEITMMRKMIARRIPPSVKRRRTLDMPDGIIGNLSQEYEGMYRLSHVKCSTGESRN